MCINLKEKRKKKVLDPFAAKYFAFFWIPLDIETNQEEGGNHFTSNSS